MSMVEIPLSKGKVAIVDDEDEELVRKYAWHFDRYAKGGYWDKEKEKMVALYMHRIIMNTPKGRLSHDNK